MLDELYKQYGELCVKQELIQNQINNVKQQINDALAEAGKKATKDAEVKKR